MKHALKTLALGALVATGFAAGFDATAAAATIGKVPVLAHNVRAGDIIAKGDITYRELNLDRLPGMPLLSGKELIGQQATHNIVAGMPLQANQVRIPPAAVRNAAITIRYVQPGLFLETRGKALQDGNIGDSIKVVNNQSNKMLVATVVGSGLVEVSN